MPVGTGKGVLRLKGDDISKSKKKKKRKDKELESTKEGAEAASKPKGTAEGYVLEPPSETADRRTAAERKYDEQMEKREAERIAKMAAKSHRQRVAEFNAHLGSLTEHMDIPKVGPG